MVDFKSYLRHGPNELIPMGELILSNDVEDDECRCDKCMADGGPKDNQRYGWDGVAESIDFHKDQYLICPPRVLGYHLMEKKWAELLVDGLSDINHKESAGAFSKLQLTPQLKTLVEELVRSQSNDKDDNTQLPRRQMEDLTKGKGEGLVILLHGALLISLPFLFLASESFVTDKQEGPPGVGKTLTAGKLFNRSSLPPLCVSDESLRERCTGHKEAFVSHGSGRRYDGPVKS